MVLIDTTNERVTYVFRRNLQTALAAGVFLATATAQHITQQLSYRRGTARCVVSVEILPTATQQSRNYFYDKS